MPAFVKVSLLNSVSAVNNFSRQCLQQVEELKIAGKVILKKVCDMSE